MLMRINNKQLNLILLAGQKMSNLCYNLAQRETIPAHDRQTMKECQEEWDAVYPKRKPPLPDPMQAQKE